MIDITTPVTITHPGGTIQTPFGPTNAPATTEEVTVTVHLDETAIGELRTVFSGAVAPTAGAHLTTAQLATQYTEAELMAAMQLALAGSK